MIDSSQRNIATLIHLSTFSRFFIPFGNFLGPLILWITNKDSSEFVDAHGKQALNFQISMFLYLVILGALTIPLVLFAFLGQNNFFELNRFQEVQIHWGSTSFLLFIAGGLVALMVLGFIFEMLCIVIASLKARDGALYRYPLSINFLK